MPEICNNHTAKYISPIFWVLPSPLFPVFRLLWCVKGNSKMGLFFKFQNLTKAWNPMKSVSEYLTSLLKSHVLRNLSQFLNRQKGNIFNREGKEDLFWKTKVNLKIQL